MSFDEKQIELQRATQKLFRTGRQHKKKHETLDRIRSTWNAHLLNVAEDQRQGSKDSDMASGMTPLRSRSVGESSSNSGGTVSNGSSPVRRYQISTSEIRRRPSKSKRTWSLTRSDRYHTRAHSRCMPEERPPCGVCVEFVSETNSASPSVDCPSSTSASIVSSAFISLPSESSLSDAGACSTNEKYLYHLGTSANSPNDGACPSESSERSPISDRENNQAVRSETSEGSSRTIRGKNQMEPSGVCDRSFKCKRSWLSSLFARTCSAGRSSTPSSYVKSFSTKDAAIVPSERSERSSNSEHSRWSSPFGQICCTSNRKTPATIKEFGNEDKAMFFSEGSSKSNRPWHFSIVRRSRSAGHSRCTSLDGSRRPSVASIGGSLLGAFDKETSTTTTGFGSENSRFINKSSTLNSSEGFPSERSFKSNRQCQHNIMRRSGNSGDSLGVTSEEIAHPEDYARSHT